MPSSGGATVVRVDSSRPDAWVYFAFGAEREVTVAGPESSKDWDLAFQRFKIKSNGGVSGAGAVMVAVVRGASFEALAQAPESGWVTDGPDGPDDNADPDWAFNVPSEGWYVYDFQTHVLTPRAQIYVVRSTKGGYFKVEMTGYYDSAGNGGYPAFRYAAVAPPAGPLVMGEPAPAARTLMVTAPDAMSWVHLSLRAGVVVPVANPANDLTWDIAFSRTLVRSNGGTSGTGKAAAVATGAKSLPEVSAIPADGFATDTMVPIPGPPGSGTYSGNPVLAEWFDYDLGALGGRS